MECIFEVSEFLRTCEGRCGGHHDRRSADHNHQRTDHRVGLFVAEPARRDALVDDIGLLEEELPGSNGGSDHRDDQQGRVGAQATLYAGDEESGDHLPRVRMAQHRQRKHQKAREKKHEHRSFPAAEVACDRDAYEQQRGHRDNHCRIQAEMLARHADAHEFRADGQEIEQEDPRHRVPAPEPAESLADEACIADAGHRTETYHHLLVHDEDRDQKQESPQQRVTEVLAGLGIGRDAAGVVVADHDDDAGADDGEERQDAAAPCAARRDVAGANGAERAVDVAEMHLVEHRRGWLRARVLSIWLALGHYWSIPRCSLRLARASLPARALR